MAAAEPLPERLLDSDTRKPVCVDEHPDQCTVLVKKGELVPFGGVLLTPAMGANLKVSIDACFDKLAESDTYRKHLSGIDKATCDQEIAALEEAATQKQATLEEAVQQAHKDAAENASAGVWNGVLWGAGGFVAGVLVTGAVIGGLLIWNGTR